MVEDTAETGKRKRARSPSYPGIDLGEAIERAETLYENEKRHIAPIGAILADWGYKPGSGLGLVAFAALKKFGLLVEEGSGAARKGRLSDDALAIILDRRPGSSERLKRIQEAALQPRIHQELWQKYGENLPSEETLRYELQVEKGFTERAVGEFVPQYRQTIEFAQLSDRDKLSVETEDKSHEVSATATIPVEAEGRVSATASIPVEAEGPPTEGYVAVSLAVAAGKFATLRAPIPMTEAQWCQMISALEAQKPGFVSSPQEEPARPRKVEAVMRQIHAKGREGKPDSEQHQAGG
jgi:hypothetical protein